MRHFLAVAAFALLAVFGTQACADEPSELVRPSDTTSATASASRYASVVPEDPDEIKLPAARPGRPWVGTLDLARVFAAHKRFQHHCDEMRAKVAAAETELKVKRAHLEELSQVAAGTADRDSQKSLNENLSLEQALLKASVETQKAQFIQMEAKIYKESYEEIQRVIALEAKARSMRVVLRVADELEGNDPQSVVKTLNKTVLYQEGIDLTSAVIAAVNGGTLPTIDVGNEPPPVEESLRGSCPVAVLDLARVYAEDAKFKVLNDAMRRDVERAEADMAMRKAELKQGTAKLSQLGKGTEAYLEKEAAIRRAQAVLESSVTQQKRQFIEQEAENYFNVYQRVLDELRRLAERKGFVLVLRISELANPSNDPEQIVKELNQTILYHRGIDVTCDVLEALNAQEASEPLLGIGGKQDSPGS
jgi:Skp family chaperone for outer membrane proteins